MPDLSISTLPKVATPPTAATGLVPERTPLFGLLSIESVTLPTKPVARFSPASRASMTRAGSNGSPASAVPGWRAYRLSLADGLQARL